MSKGFGYRYENGALRFSIKYGPTILGVVVNNKWRRIVFSYQEGAASAIKSLEKAQMYERYIEHMRKLEEIPDEYYDTLYNIHLRPYVRNYVPTSDLSVSVDDVDYNLDYLSKKYLPTGIRRGEIPLSASAYTVSTGRARASQWLQGDWAEAIPTDAMQASAPLYPTQSVPIQAPPIPTDVYVDFDRIVNYPTDLAIENMRGTEQERERARRQANLLNALDRMSATMLPRR